MRGTRACTKCVKTLIQREGNSVHWTCTERQRPASSSEDGGGCPKNAKAGKTSMNFIVFVRIINYLGRFIPHLSTILDPLHQLTRTDSNWLWTPTEKEAFQKAKQAVTSPPVLEYFDKDITPTLQYVDSEQCYCKKVSPLGMQAGGSPKLNSGTHKLKRSY